MKLYSSATSSREISPVSLHDALPICEPEAATVARKGAVTLRPVWHVLVYGLLGGDRKSTRLNSSNLVNSDAVFCLKKRSNAFQHMSYGFSSLLSTEVS